MQVQRVQNNNHNYNTNFTAIRNVHGKGHFCPTSVDSDLKDLEYLVSLLVFIPPFSRLHHLFP